MKKVAAFVVILGVVAGCDHGKHVTPVVAYRTSTAAALLESYNHNAAGVTTLSADLDMTFFYLGEKGRARKQRVSAWLDVEKPGKLRLKHDALGRDMFNVVSDGERFWIGLDAALAGERIVYTGSLAAVAGESFLRPDRLMTAFSLSELPPAGTAETFFEAYKDVYVITFVDDGEPRRILAKATFSRVDLRLNRYQVFDEEARLVLDVLYQLYDSVDGVDVPELLTIKWPLDDFSTLTKVAKVKVGAALPPSLWQFKWRDDAEIIDLGEGNVLLEE